ncbi:MAG: bifunctional metallophosphatase/5'-nucleotidase [Prevotellaceae bacterium]|jgi:2',3'-cyclic-nucleotide 2'-phosphodiesterase (5'-nucleotidase family)|nr:bifunctional metallophosphatase/5'-nucleotidase [Prevotellaceae bacterium]
MRTAYCLLLTACCLLHLPLCAQDTLTILFTHDLHSYFEGTKEQDKQLLNTGRVGGYARLATEINRFRAAQPNNTLLLDAGDAAMGTFYHFLFVTQFAELQIMNKMGYDAVTIGNHDFDFGATALQEAIDNGEYILHKAGAGANPHIITSNLHGLQGTKEYIVLEKAGYRIGIFGLLGKDALKNIAADQRELYVIPKKVSRVKLRELRKKNEQHTRDEDILEPYTVSFEDPVLTAKRMVEILRNEEKVDIVICLSHSGTNKRHNRSEDEQLAEQVPGIDVIISGHTHSVLQDPLMAKQTLIGSAGAYGKYLGIIKLLSSENKIKFIDYRLVEINETIEEDSLTRTTAEKFSLVVNERFLQPAGIAVNEPIAVSKVFLPANPDSLALGSLVADAFRYTAQQNDEQYINVAAVPRGNIRSNLFPGPVTTADVFQILSLGNVSGTHWGYPLLKLYVTGKELRDICEVDASISWFMPDMRLFFSGLRYSYNSGSLIFNRVKKVEVMDSTGNYVELVNKQLYSIVCGLYTAQLVGFMEDKSFNILSVKPKDASSNAITDLLIAIIRDEKGEELKEWLALQSYLKSFPIGDNNLPQINFSDRLSERKIKEKGFSLKNEIKYMNNFALYVYVIFLLLSVTFLLLLFVITRKIIRWYKK